MIKKPEQQDKEPTIGYLSKISEQVIQARIDINEALQNSDEEEIDKIVFDERDRVADAFVKLLEAWQDVSERNFPDAIGEAAIAEEVATQSSLRVWDKLAASVYDDAVRALGKKISITVANLTKPVQLKIDGEKARRSAMILYEQNDYAAINKYRESVGLLKKSKEQAELARFSVRGQTLQAWVKILLYLLTVVLATISIIVTVRGCIPKSNQIPSNRTVPAQPNEPNLSK